MIKDKDPIKIFEYIKEIIIENFNLFKITKNKKEKLEIMRELIFRLNVNKKDFEGIRICDRCNNPFYYGFNGKMICNNCKSEREEILIKKQKEKYDKIY